MAFSKRLHCWLLAVAMLLVGKCPPVFGAGITSLEATPAPSVMQRVDAAFGAAVDGIAQVLFYRLFPRQREFVQLNHVEHYTRSVGSKGDFQRFDSSGEFESDSLTPQQVDALNAQGKLELIGDKVVLRGETDDGTEVEYVSVVMDTSSKYVKEPGSDAFHKVLPKRDLISDELALSEAEIKRLAELGRLKTDDAGNYILSETTGGAPLVVLWLGLGSIFFTFFMGWFNIWGFTHAVEVVRGKYDNPDEPGEVTHFQALASALSATVGLGNIAGVTIAMTMGGPGAFFWMMACGVFGMSSKFVECTLGQKYRRVKPDGTVLGGPMQYLHEGLKELGLGPLGFVLSIIFAVMCIMASFGGGNMFQANQSGSTVLSMIQKQDIKSLEQLNADIRQAATDNEYDKLSQLQTERQTLQGTMSSTRNTFVVIYGILLATAVGFVIIGGIKRIGAAAEKLVPTMCLIYMAACLWIILMHVTEVPELIGSIFSQAFTGKAFGGGMLGVLVLGVQRAAFSNEAGVGSAAIAHSAAKTEEPIREGAVALLGPFIDTVVVCSMTALVILITGAWDYDPWVVDQGLQGAALTSVAFEREIGWFPYILALAVVLFAFSTIISWSYYGERCWERLFGPNSTFVYRMIYVLCVLIGAVVNLGAVLDFSDMMILSMAFPNILGVVLLSPKVKRDLADYWRRYKAGEFKTFT